MKLHYFISLFAVLLVIILLIYCVPAYHDKSYVCKNTGSFKGYRQWAFGTKTGHWYRKSPLEEFMEEEDPNLLVCRWTFFSGGGNNIFGRTFIFEDGFPGAVTNLRHRELKLWVQHNKPEDVRQLYDLLVSDDQDKIKEKVNQIWEEYRRYEEEKAPR